MENNRHIILNRIRTPDGTVLTSRYVHEYVSHIDKNGREYATDGGTAYLHRIVNDAPYEDLTVYSDSPFEEIRKVFHWGTYGPDGNGELKFVILCEMEESHIDAILRTQKRLAAWKKELFQKELDFRKLLSAVE